MTQGSIELQLVPCDLMCVRFSDGEIGVCVCVFDLIVILSDCQKVK